MAADTVGDISEQYVTNQVYRSANDLCEGEVGGGIGKGKEVKVAGARSAER